MAWIQSKILSSKQIRRVGWPRRWKPIQSCQYKAVPPACHWEAEPEMSHEAENLWKKLNGLTRRSLDPSRSKCKSLLYLGPQIKMNKRKLTINIIKYVKKQTTVKCLQKQITNSYPWGLKILDLWEAKHKISISYYLGVTGDDTKTEDHTHIEGQGKTQNLVGLHSFAWG